jgi:dextranase
VDLIFSKGSFHPFDEVTGHISISGDLAIYSLSSLVKVQQVSSDFNLGKLAEGSYGVKFTSMEGEISFSAIEVISNPIKRIRYGFVSEFSDSVKVEDYVEWSRRLHLTGILFYDWAYKHELLTTPEEHYGDPLGAMISAKKIKELIKGYASAGAQSFGYAAVYAVDRAGWARWSAEGVYNSIGTPYQLGENFLWLVDPADSKWLSHFIDQLKLANNFGFHAFHLDQYGWPKIAYKKDGSIIDLAVQFPTMLNQITHQLPESTFIFNNVNDFPTWSTSQTDQDAIYIEVWDPHSEYQHLADLVSKARSYSPEKPIILSAYLKPFSHGESEVEIELANNSFKLCFASIVSGGASHLITGGDGRVLHDPYYVRNHKASEATRKVIEEAFNFSVAVGDLLFDPSRVDVTLTSAFGINEEVKVESNAILSSAAKAGTVWVRIFQGKSGLTIHFINFMDQIDSIWDSPKKDINSSPRVQISINAAGFSTSVSVGSMGESSIFENVEVCEVSGRFETSVVLTNPWTIVNFPILQ